MIREISCVNQSNDINQHINTDADINSYVLEEIIDSFKQNLKGDDVKNDDLNPIIDEIINDMKNIDFSKLENPNHLMTNKSVIVAKNKKLEELESKVLSKIKENYSDVKANILSRMVIAVIKSNYLKKLAMQNKNSPHSLLFFEHYASLDKKINGYKIQFLIESLKEFAGPNINLCLKERIESLQNEKKEKIMSVVSMLKGIVNNKNSGPESITFAGEMSNNMLGLLKWERSSEVAYSELHNEMHYLKKLESQINNKIETEVYQYYIEDVKQLSDLTECKKKLEQCYSCKSHLLSKIDQHIADHRIEEKKDKFNADLIKWNSIKFFLNMTYDDIQKINEEIRKRNVINNGITRFKRLLGVKSSHEMTKEELIHELGILKMTYFRSNEEFKKIEHDMRGVKNDINTSNEFVMATMASIGKISSDANALEAECGALSKSILSAANMKMELIYKEIGKLTERYFSITRDNDRWRGVNEINEILSQINQHIGMGSDDNSAREWNGIPAHYYNNKDGADKIMQMIHSRINEIKEISNSISANINVLHFHDNEINELSRVAPDIDLNPHQMKELYNICCEKSWLLQLGNYVNSIIDDKSNQAIGVLYSNLCIESNGLMSIPGPLSLDELKFKFNQKLNNFVLNVLPKIKELTKSGVNEQNAVNPDDTITHNSMFLDQKILRSTNAIDEHIDSLRKIGNHDHSRQSLLIAEDFLTREKDVENDIFIDRQFKHGTCVIHAWNTIYANMNEYTSPVLTPYRIEVLVQQHLIENAMSIIDDIDNRVNNHNEFFNLIDLQIALGTIYKEIAYISPHGVNYLKSNGALMDYSKEQRMLTCHASNLGVNDIDMLTQRDSDLESTGVKVTSFLSSDKMNSHGELSSYMDLSLYDAFFVVLSSPTEDEAHAVSLIKKNDIYYLVDSNFSNALIAPLQVLFDFFEHGRSSSPEIDQMLIDRGYSRYNIFTLCCGVIREGGVQ